MRIAPGDFTLYNYLHNNSQTPMYNLNTFVESLIEEKGLSYLDDLMLAEMKNDLLNRIEDRLNVVIVQNMPEANMAEFEKMMDDKASDEELQKFCEKNIPDLSSLVAIDLARFKDVYLGK